MRVIILAVAFLLSCAAQANVIGRVAQVSANLSGTGYTIPSGFVGLSGEVGDLIAGLYQGPCSGSNGSWLGVANLLGSNGVFRLGGNSSDQSSGAPALTSGIATNLATFMGCMGAGWKLIYGLNLQINNSSTAATQAGLIATAMGGGANVVFQFGNEAIGNYVTKTQYETNWNAYYTAVLAAVTGLKVAATDSEDFGDTQVVIAALTPGVSGMTYVTQHWYGEEAADTDRTGEIRLAVFSVLEDVWNVDDRPVEDGAGGSPGAVRRRGREPSRDGECLRWVAMMSNKVNQATFESVDGRPRCRAKAPCALGDGIENWRHIRR